MPRIPLFLLRLLLLLLAVPGIAVASVTTGSIKGDVVDEQGIGMPGVLVSISSANLMGVKQQDSDGEGRFLFAELPPGRYTVKAEFKGYKTINLTDVLVNIGRTSAVTVNMVASVAQEEMVIEAERKVIDTESGGQTTVLTKEFLERIPTGRSYQAAVQLSAGVTGGSNPNMGGSASNENTYMLDGVNITDPVTGTFSLNFNFDAIEQIEVLISQFDPEYGTDVGGGINIVTSSGTNTLKIITGVYVTNGNWSPKKDAIFTKDGSQLVATDFDSQYETYEAGLSVSGPVIRDKAWLLTSYQYTHQLYRVGGNPLPQDYDAHYLLGKLTVQPVAAHRFTVLTQTDPTTIDNLNQDSRFYKPEAQSRQAQGGWLGSFQWDWFISDRAFLETKTILQKSFLENHQVGCTHDQEVGYNPCDPDELENTVDFLTPARVGANGAYSNGNSTAFSIDDRWRMGVQTRFSLLQVPGWGTHDLKIGADLYRTSTNRAVGFSGNLQFVDVNRTYFDPNSTQAYYWFEVSGAHFHELTGDTLGLFIQDVYKPISNLTFRYGLRYDQQSLTNDVGEEVLSAGLLGPRFTTSWDPWSDGKSKLTGSVGRFNDTSNLAVADDLSQAGSSFGSKVYYGQYFGSQGIAYPSLNGFDGSAGYDSAINRTTVLDNLTAPHVDAFLLGAERQIIKDLAIKAYFNGKFTRNIYVFDETNVLWDEDGYNTLGYANGDALSYSRLRSPSIARRDYFRTDLELQKVRSDNWEMDITYSYTVSRGSVQEGPSYFLSVAPQVEYWENGYLTTDIRHDVTGGITYDLPTDPWTTQVGSVISYESGYPVSRFYENANQEGLTSLGYAKWTRGSYARTEGAWKLDIRVAQEIPVKKGKMSGVVNLFNVTNNQRYEAAGVFGRNRWAYARQSPITLQVGLEYRL
jgi:hypothetical protein